VVARDLETAEHKDFRVIRVWVGFCDIVQLPPPQWFTYCDSNVFWTRYDVSIEVEQCGVAPPPPPPPPPPSPGGVGGDDRSKGKGKWLDLRAGSSQDGAVQHPAKNVNSCTKGKGPIQSNVHVTSQEVEILPTGDLVPLAPISIPPSTS
jgi:hypothetical protein